jgi:hypothetical protein
MSGKKPKKRQRLKKTLRHFHQQRKSFETIMYSQPYKHFDRLQVTKRKAQKKKEEKTRILREVCREAHGPIEV